MSTQVPCLEMPKLDVCKIEAFECVKGLSANKQCEIHVNNGRDE